MAKPDYTEFRKNLAVFDDGLFLNYAATAPLTRSSIDRIKEAAEAMKHPLGAYLYEALNQLEFCRRDIADLIGALPTEIAFTQNTSTAVSMIALSIDWQPGDRVLVPDNEFPSNFYPWANLAHKGVIFETFRLEKNRPVVETLSQINLDRVRLIAASAVSFETGRCLELEAFCQFCRDRKIRSCLDAIQAIGAIDFDVKKIGVDFVASGAQKWLLGPVGCGFIYARHDLLEKLQVPFLGWTSVQYPEYFNLKSIEFPNEMTRFEPGLPSYLPLVGMASSLRELKTLGWGSIFGALRDQRSYLATQLEEMGLTLLTGSNDQAAGIVSFEIPRGLGFRDAQALYEAAQIKVTARQTYVRVAPHFFNSRREIDLFLEKTEHGFKTRKAKAIAVAKSPESNAVVANVQQILLTGATGALGRALALEFARRGYALHLLGRKQALLDEVVGEVHREVPAARLETSAVDFSIHQELDDFLAKAPAQSYSGLVNCAGLVEAGLFSEVPLSTHELTFRVNSLAPLRLTHEFLRRLRASGPTGILNIVSSTGRCGSPLLTSYSASNAALWTFSESLARELADTEVHVCTYIASAMHSPMQKRMGRLALRYFRMGGHFEFNHCEETAIEAVEVFLEKRAFFIGKSSRMKVFTNALWPELISQKISKIWRT